MGKTIKKKLHSGKGFTLAETLLAVLILLLVSGIVASGIPSAQRAYEKVVLASNARILLSTTTSALRSELGSAKDVEIVTAGKGEKADSVITYYNTGRNSSSKIYVNAKDKEQPEIMLQRYFSAEKLSADYAVTPLVSDATPLVSDAAATADLYVTYDKVTYDKTTGIIKFEKLEVRRGSGSETDAVLAQMESLSIRGIMY